MGVPIKIGFIYVHWITKKKERKPQHKKAKKLNLN